MKKLLTLTVAVLVLNLGLATAGFAGTDEGKDAKDR